MRFRHKRTGKIIEATADTARRYLNRRWEPYDHLEPGQDWEPANVPLGSIAVVLAWVGGDELRRQSALTVERQGKNRKSLIAKLSN